MITETHNGEKKMKIEIGSHVFVEYANGKLYTGEVEKVRTMPQDRILFTVNDPQGYKSLYLDKCVSVEVWEAVK
mgnify:CR=1 FL=1